MRRTLAVLAAVVSCLAIASIAQAATPPSPPKGPMPNVSIVYGPTEVNSQPVSSATVWDPQNSSFMPCALSICGGFTTTGSGANKKLVLNLPRRDKVRYGAIVYVDKAGDSHQVAHVRRGQRIPVWTNITALGTTAKYQLVSVQAYVFDPKEPRVPADPACISHCVP